MSFDEVAPNFILAIECTIGRFRSLGTLKQQGLHLHGSWQQQKFPAHRH